MNCPVADHPGVDDMKSEHTTYLLHMNEGSLELSTFPALHSGRSFVSYQSSYEKRTNEHRLSIGLCWTKNVRNLAPLHQDCHSFPFKVESGVL